MPANDKEFINDGLFSHQCIDHGCVSMIEYDDEPWCFTHSPDSGSSVPGYSVRARLSEGITNNEED